MQIENISSRLIPIQCTESDISFISRLLECGVFNDYLFERAFFKLRIIPDTAMDLLYRKLWETTYFKSGCSYLENDRVVMTLSLSEALGFINRAVPPILRKQIPESTKKISDIRDLLNQLLMDDNGGQQITYHSIFKDITHFQYFDTNWTDDVDKALLLRDIHMKKNTNKNPSPPPIICRVVCSDEPIRIWMDANEDKNANVGCKAQLIFHCMNIDDVVLLTKELLGQQNDYDDGELRITNIMMDKTHGIFISALYDGLLSWNDSKLHDIIKTTYSGIM